MIKHRTYVIHIKCHTLKGDRYLLETARQGRERDQNSLWDFAVQESKPTAAIPKRGRAEKGWEKLL